MKFVAVVAVFAVLAGLAAAQQCSLPAIATDIEGFAGLYLQTATAVSNSVCPGLTATCCSAELNTKMGQAFDLFRSLSKTAYNGLTAAIAATNNEIETGFNLAMTALDALGNTPIPGTNINANDFKNTLSNLKNAITKWVNNAPGVYSNCIQAGLVLGAGTTCMLCDPNAASFVSKTSNGYVFTYDQSTCDGLYRECSTITQSLQTLVNDVSTALTGIPAADVASFFGGVNIDGFSPCGSKTDAECKQYFCNNFVLDEVLSLMYSALAQTLNLGAPPAVTVQYSASSSSGYPAFSKGQSTNLPIGTQDITGANPTQPVNGASTASVATLGVAAAAAVAALLF